MDIATQRLDLLLITTTELSELSNAPTNEPVFHNRSFTNPYGILTQERIPHANRIEDVQRNPSHIKWYYRLIVERESRTLIGSISFHAPPDINGMVEVGFGLASEYRGNGYGRETLEALWLWACQQPEVKVLRYTVSPDNRASQAIIARYPTKYLGQQIDDEDGPEDIYEINCTDFLKFYGQL